MKGNRRHHNDGSTKPPLYYFALNIDFNRLRTAQYEQKLPFTPALNDLKCIKQRNRIFKFIHSTKKKNWSSRPLWKTDMLTGLILLNIPRYEIIKLKNRGSKKRKFIPDEVTETRRWSCNNSALTRQS